MAEAILCWIPAPHTNGTGCAGMTRTRIHNTYYPRETILRHFDIAQCRQAQDRLWEGHPTVA
jgi:hypothetical protein